MTPVGVLSSKWRDCQDSAGNRNGEGIGRVLPLDLEPWETEPRINRAPLIRFSPVTPEVIAGHQQAPGPRPALPVCAGRAMPGVAGLNRQMHDQVLLSFH